MASFHFYMTWEAIRLLDKSDHGNQKSHELLRIVTPMLKRQTAENGVYSVRESMEIMGGIGYIEDGVMPKIMRDMMVLPIWEGAGNIMCLDMLRASHKSEGFSFLMDEIEQNLSGIEFEDELKSRVIELNDVHRSMVQNSRDEMESVSKKIFEELTFIFQISLLNKYTDESSKTWTLLAMEFLSKKVLNKEVLNDKPKSVDQIDGLIGWSSTGT